MANSIRKFPNVTKRKTATVANLEFEIANQTTAVAQATAKNQALQQKLQSFTNLLNDKEALLNTAQANYDQYLTIEKDVINVTTTTNTSSGVSQNTYALAKGMLLAWQEVGQSALKAATEIAELTDYIQKRKASNPLINDDLVNMAVDANNTAKTSVQKVISALVEAMASVSMASKASQTTNLTVLYAQLAENYAIGNNDNSTTSEAMQAAMARAVKKVASTGSDIDKEALKLVVTQALVLAQNDVKAYQNAVKTISAQAATAQTELEAAQQELTALQQALAAAKTALLLTPPAAPAAPAASPAPAAAGS